MSPWNVFGETQQPFGIFLIGIMRRVTGSEKESAETGGHTLGLKSARQEQILPKKRLYYYGHNSPDAIHLFW